MQIKKITLHRFKQFQATSIDLRGGLSLIVGGNNSGKSSVLQALATWQFCKTLLEIEKGPAGWLPTVSKAGIGLGIVDFTPLQLPALSHLWTNLKTIRESEPDGYTLKIGVYWDIAPGDERHLEIGLALSNDRLFIKATSTNLKANEVNPGPDDSVGPRVPRVAYLPPFAGITDRENRLSPAMRARLLGQGLSGGVIRNMLFEMHSRNQAARLVLRGDKPKIKNSDLRRLRQNDAWEILLRTTQSIFGTDLRMMPFNERYHSYLRVECVKGKVKDDGSFERFPRYNARDIMVEGSGFLQWLSVYALALSDDVDIVLLDEPDAHLNAALQKELLLALDNITDVKNKQVLLATHSPELIRLYDHDRILAVANRKAKYMADAAAKVSVLGGIGTVHTPTLHALMESRRLLILEAPSDERFLKTIAERAGVAWPEKLVPWYWTGSAGERHKLYMQLLKEIPGLKAISIRDRDDEPSNTTSSSLFDKSFPSKEAGYKALKWRRRHVENYLLSKEAIARAADVDVQQVNDYFAQKHSLLLPDDPTPSDVVAAVQDAHAKEIFTKGDTSLKRFFSITRDDVAAKLEKAEVAEDMLTLFKEIEALMK
ncbi:ATP-dependent nuclease [Paracidovorax oryzae]|uniref:ATP-dependent nuclease n=1 Tax=Paracidovorax oryzae TaxID=862720 RepID=UPI000550231D|nr:ATP-binding protein [Paracidovorax oryzae]